MKKKIIISAIILAAGKSSRMGKNNKLCLIWKNKPIIAHVIETVIDSNVDEVILVTGHESYLFEKYSKIYQIKITKNLNFEHGMMSSINSGIKTLSKNVDAWMICLGDQPRIKSYELNKIIQKFKENWTNKDLIALPISEGIRRNPVIFSNTFKERFYNHDGEGAKEIIKNSKSDIIEVPILKSKIFDDVDNINDYQILKRDK